MDAAPQDIFSSEEGAIMALSAIRNSSLPTEVKAKLRDLFLSFTGEPDPGKRQMIQKDIVSALSANADRLPPMLRGISANTPTAQPILNMTGRKRPTPQFTIKAKESAAAAAEVKAPTEPPKVAEVATATVPPPTSDLRSRVDSIKHEINSRVGNPVNLINADEAVGREYMAAILDAMKNAGKGGEDASRTRLENAYKAAVQVIEKMPQAAPTAAEVIPEPIAAPTTEVKTVPEVAPAAPIRTEERRPEIKVIHASKPKVSEGLYHQPIDEAETRVEAKPSGLSSLTNRLWKKGKEETPKNEPAIVPQNSVATATPIRRLNVDSGAVVQNEPPKVEPPKSEPLHSLKDATTLDKDMVRLKEAAEEREEAAKRPIVGLDAPEVQAGLEQLLSEWKLFRSSGWLGTGPSGINHPLYKQLQKLPMAAVVAGRFEGATPEIKQDLGDYMGGWRYEQGVVHEMGENFEHYLRRVIKQIIEKQRKVVAT